MKEQSKPEGQGFWKEHFESWKLSGLTQQAYCSLEGISYQSFVYQHNRVNSKLKKTPINFIEAKIKSIETSKNSSGLQVVLPNGVRIGFDGEITAALVQTVFSILGKNSDGSYSITHQQLDWLLAGLDFKLMAEFPQLDFTHYF